MQILKGRLIHNLRKNIVDFLHNFGIHFSLLEFLTQNFAIQYFSHQMFPSKIAIQIQLVNFYHLHIIFYACRDCDRARLNCRTAKHLITAIESNAGNNSNLKGVLHALLLLKEVLGVFPKQQIKAACETILKIMTLGNAITVKNYILKALTVGIRKLDLSSTVWIEIIDLSGMQVTNIVQSSNESLF